MTTGTPGAIPFNWHSFSFVHPVNREPTWKAKVPRWSQLDAPAYGLAEAFTVWRDQLKRPDLILLASPGASNETDRKFTRTGASSPSLFVHTLPNIRCSPMLQVMEWSGPVLCVQNDPSTMTRGLIEAAWLVAAGEAPTVWVLSVVQEGDAHVAHVFEVLSSGYASFELCREPGEPVVCDDKALADWLNQPMGSLRLGSSHVAQVSSRTKERHGRITDQ
ncbi:MAG TPA: hypothetical protein VFV50_05250 [Bdellovibrionales bacterium]|nr:hypothetical protein [Bdellovibrionales bacterium]